MTTIKTIQPKIKHYSHLIFRVSLVWISSGNRKGSILNSRPTVHDVWSSFTQPYHSKDRRHLLRLKILLIERIICCYRLTHTSFLIRNKGWQEDEEWSTTSVAYLSTIVQFGHPPLLEVQEVGLWGKEYKQRHIHWPSSDRSVTNIEKGRKDFCCLHQCHKLHKS